jgi:hypothetical protein
MDPASWPRRPVRIGPLHRNTSPDGLNGHRPEAQARWSASFLWEVPLTGTARICLMSVHRPATTPRALHTVQLAPKERVARLVPYGLLHVRAWVSVVAPGRRRRWNSLGEEVLDEDLHLARRRLPPPGSRASRRSRDRRGPDRVIASQSNSLTASGSTGTSDNAAADPLPRVVDRGKEIAAVNAPSAATTEITQNAA